MPPPCLSHTRTSLSLKYINTTNVVTSVNSLSQHFYQVKVKKQVMPISSSAKCNKINRFNFLSIRSCPVYHKLNPALLSSCAGTLQSRTVCISVWSSFLFVCICIWHFWYDCTISQKSDIWPWLWFCLTQKQFFFPNVVL